MRLVPPTENHLLEMMTWFTTEQLLTDWAGPNFRFPFDQMTFCEDLKLKDLNSYALVSPNDELLGFGQFYQRIGKCHLGRLVVNPSCRGQGYASNLITSLCNLGMRELKLNQCSLFVLAHNASAMKAYKKFGFCEAIYPEPIGLDNCIYMVK